MSDEAKEIEEIQTEGTSIEENKDVEAQPTEEVQEIVNTDDVPDSSGNKPDEGPGFVKKTMEKLGWGKKVDEGVDAPEGEKEKESEEENEAEEIPDGFTEAARKQGWTDEEIINFSESFDNEELKKIIPDLFPEETQEPSVGQQPGKDLAKTEETPQSPEDSQDEDKLASFKEEIRAELRREFQEEIGSLRDRLGDVSKETEARQREELINTVNEAFDNSGFDIFGKTDELPKYPAGPKKGQIVPVGPVMEARSEVFEKAQAFMSLGADVREAMQDALTWYKGKHLEKDLHRKMVKELKSKETKLSAKRSAKETAPVFESEEDRQVDFIRREAERLGMKLAEED